MIYHSKVDVYILAAIVLAIGVFLLGDYWIAGPILLVLLLCAYPQSYETAAQGLVVRTALTKTLIPYQAISEIGPAAGETEIFSFTSDRIRIQYGLASDILIAPANRVAFITDIANRAPHLTRRGQKLTAVFA
ncbi:MAG TPA: PH domain-containing protein [Bryobacteraceae bacterium]|nr:PH domain-containing protein [Bryobacteraceae bacterium]